jgi:hypothetical protein
MEILTCIDALGMGGSEGDAVGPIADLRKACIGFIVQQPPDIFAAILVKAMRGKDGKKKKQKKQPKQVGGCGCMIPTSPIRCSL